MSWSASIELPNVRLSQRGAKSSDVSLQGQTVCEIPDEVLLSRTCDGDKEALADLFRRYARVVRSVAYKILRDYFEADDLLQEIFILVQKKAATFDSSKASVRFWILQMTYHRAITRRRYLSCRHFYTQVDLQDAEPELRDPRTDADRIEEWIDNEARTSDLQKLMAGLSDNQQKTLKLYFFEGYVCSWCEIHGSRLILVPTVHSGATTRQVRYPGDADIVGRVTAVTMRIAEPNVEP